jgi:hypothetical protein
VEEFQPRIIVNEVSGVRSRVQGKSLSKENFSIWNRALVRN